MFYVGYLREGVDGWTTPEKEGESGRDTQELVITDNEYRAHHNL